MDWVSLEDAANELCRDTFGEAATYTPLDGSAAPIRAVFSEEFEEVLPDTGAAVVSQRPSVFVRLADLPATPTEGDRLTIRGRLYAVSQDPHVDGTGGAVLLLKRIT